MLSYMMLAAVLARTREVTKGNGRKFFDLTAEAST